LNNSVDKQIVFKNVQGGDLIAGGFLISISLLSLGLIYDGQSNPPSPLVAVIVSVLFLTIGLMGAWDASRTLITVTPKDQIIITRLRLATNRMLYQREVIANDIEYIHYVKSVTRGGGLWFVLRDGSRIELATINRMPLPLAIWPNGYLIHTKAEKLSRSLGISLNV
jgi:hypothetical protein